MACAAAVLVADPVCELAMPVRLLHKAALTFKHCVLQWNVIYGLALFVF